MRPRDPPPLLQKDDALQMVLLGAAAGHSAPVAYATLTRFRHQRKHWDGVCGGCQVAAPSPALPRRATVKQTLRPCSSWAASSQCLIVAEVPVLGKNMNGSNESESCSSAGVDQLMKTVQVVVHIPTFLLGLVLNLLAIRGFRAFLRKRLLEYVATCIYMINLALFDLLMVLSLLFKIVLVYVQAPFPSLCSLVECLYFISMYGGIFTICFISLDRYLAIQYPFLVSHRRSPRKIFGICCAIWVLVWAGSIPFYNFSWEEERYTCFNNLSMKVWSASIVFPVEVFGFLLPLGIMGFCSFKSIHILVSRQDTTPDLDRKTRACIWTIASSLVVFVFSFLPVHISFFLQFLVRNRFILECRVKQNITFFVKLSMCLSNINCCLDVFCYYFAIKEFHMGIRAQQNSRDQVELDLFEARTTVVGERKPSAEKGSGSPGS